MGKSHEYLGMPVEYSGKYSNQRLIISCKLVRFIHVKC